MARAPWCVPAAVREDLEAWVGEVFLEDFFAVEMWEAVLWWVIAVGLAALARAPGAVATSRDQDRNDTDDQRNIMRIPRPFGPRLFFVRYRTSGPLIEAPRSIRLGSAPKCLPGLLLS